MKNWIKTHRTTFIGICFLAYTVATAIPICVSYGWLQDIRPLILGTDIFTFALGVGNIISGEIF